ncbi:type II toxin-antitoxin system HicB family antitoxin [Methylopila henanensis]|uniref:Type II toxin-antitoxin system HicB family antitoxin n=1 Tax=Methylopila henanensis TaxID=873516 RepID=A0ABW4KBQ1_9HYPH
MSDLSYPIVVTPLTEEDGGGFMATVPDLRGCMADGETEIEAIASAHEAILEWIDEARSQNLEIPAPMSGGAKMKEYIQALKNIIDTQTKLFEEQDKLIEGYEAQLRGFRSQLDTLSDQSAPSWGGGTGGFVLATFAASRNKTVEVH